MKKIALILAVCLLGVTSSYANQIWNDFSANVTEQNVRAFTKDLGGLIGSGTYTTGRVLGWGGFQIGPRGSMIFKMSKANGNTAEERNHTAL